MVIYYVEDFNNQLIQYGRFDNVIINLPDYELLVEVLHHDSIIFNNCKFNCQSLTFSNIHNEAITISFNNCTFNCHLNFSDFALNKILFDDTKSLKSLNINNRHGQKGKLNVFRFSNFPVSEKAELNTDFSINNITVNNFFLFEHIIHLSGKLHLYNNILGIEVNEYGNTVFNNSTISNVHFKDNTFKNWTYFLNTIIKYNNQLIISESEVYTQNKFYKNTFEKVKFTKSQFIGKCEFERCDFLSTTWFEKCENLNNSHLNFVACEFKGFVLFNRSTLNFLNLDRCTFDKSVSFTDALFIKIKLFEIKFHGGAYFDEMRINNVDNKSYLKDNDILDWKRTLRAIKQELQKTENKIDFNRFRAYELAAHYEELGWGWKSGFKDKFILWATKWSTDFGNSWRRSLAFTLLSGLIWYSIFFYLDFYLTGYYQYYFNTNYAGIFGNGYFRFLLVTDFYNPLVEDRTYIQNFWSWIPFIFGKIFVAFGIYEMIQSFRKFKA